MRLLYQICKNIAGCTIKSAKYDWRSAAIYEILFWHRVHEFRDRQWDGKPDARKPILDNLRPDNCPELGSWTEKRPLDKCLDEWKWCQTNLQRKNVNRDENKDEEDVRRSYVIVIIVGIIIIKKFQGVVVEYVFVSFCDR